MEWKQKSNRKKAEKYTMNWNSVPWKYLHDYQDQFEQIYQWEREWVTLGMKKVFL